MAVTDGPPEEPPRSPEETRRLRRWIRVVYFALGIFLIVTAIVNPTILNVIVVPVWFLGGVTELVVQFRERKRGSGEGR